MFDTIQINILKLAYKLFPVNSLAKKINNFYVDKAYKTLSKLENAKKNNFSASKIKNVLLSSDIKLNIKDDQFYYALLHVITDNRNYTENKNFLKNYLKKDTFDTVEFRSWLRLRDIFYLKYEMVLGGICRKNAINSATKGIGFLITNKDKARAKLDKMLNSAEVDKSFQKFLFEYKFPKKILENFLSSINKIKLGSKTYENKDFFKILNNKNVAIVGPAKTNSNDAYEIDNFDIIIRLNFRHVTGNIDKVNKGLKTDISYYNGFFIEHLIDNKKGKIPIDLLAACIKDNNSNRTQKIEKANTKKIIKGIANYNILPFYSSLNLLHLALLDLLEYNVKSIKIFHSDLFLTKDLNRNFFPKAEMKEPRNLVFLGHDPMNQHEILQKLYKNKKITGDTKFDEVMKLDTFEYLKQLEDIYK